jgi:hypothetical protein
MDIKHNANQAEIDKLAKKLAKLVEIFRRGGKANDFQWWNSNSPRSIFNSLYGYQDGQPLFEEVVQGVLSLNPEMLSEHEIETKIMFDFLQKQTISWTEAEHLYNESLINEAKLHLHKLIEFEAWQDVDIPIANLWLEGEPVKLGNVTFVTITEQELKQWISQKVLWSEKAPDVHVLSKVRAPGDRQKALPYARTRVNLILDVFRAFCFPFGHHSDTWLVGIVGEIISTASTPMRIDNRNFVTQLGPGLTLVELRKHILSKLAQPQWELIDKLTLKTNYSNMESKLLDGIHWLSESTKPDTNNSKFAKISFALETLIGGEPKAEELKVRGITAMLAERAAFIMGENLNDRLAIDKDVRDYYKKRGGIVHGSKGEVTLDDIDGFGQLVRRIAIALLEKPDELGAEISDVDKLQAWVNKKKYTFPSNNSKEAPCHRLRSG